MIGYELLARWGPRESYPIDDARTLGTFVQRLEALGEPLASWFLSEKGSGIPLAKLAAPERIAELSRHLTERTSHWEHAGRHYTARQAFLTNARQRVYECDVDAKLGISTPPTTIWFPNYVRITFSAPQATAPLAEPDGADQLVRLVIEHFSPELVSLRAGDVPEATVTERLSGVPLVGWFTYIVPLTPAPAPPDPRAEHFGRGWLCRSQLAWFNPRNQADIEAVESLKRSLAASGFLEARGLQA
jgi:hypothetical protein